jgi:hypothetical protein
MPRQQFSLLRDGTLPFMESYPAKMFVAITPFLLLIALWVALFIWYKKSRDKAKRTRSENGGGFDLRK